MAIRQPNKSLSLDGLGNVGSSYEKELRKAALCAVKDDGTIVKVPASVFMLNPNSYEDSKSANWARQVVPGQSDPVMQWVSSGERVVSFEALVTADTSYYEMTEGTFKKPGEPTDPTQKFLAKVGEIASAFFKISIPQPREEIKRSNIGKLDISEFLNYYRSLLYPTYDNPNHPRKLQFSPPLLVLYDGGSISKLKYENKISSLHDLWVLTDLKIRVTKQLPNLAPMEAVVQFTLVQYNIRSFDRSRFTS